jgi:hypothetical protein
MNKWIIVLIILSGILFCFPYLAGVPPFKQISLRIIEKKLDAKLKVEHLRLSWLGPQKGIGVQFKTPELNGSFQEIDANSPLWAIRRDFTFSGGLIQAPQKTSIEKIEGVIAGSKIEASGITRTEKETGKFFIGGTAQNQNEFQLAFDMTKMPTAVVDWLLKAQGMLESLVGATFDLKGTASAQNKNGKIDLDLTSPTASASLAASINADSVILQKPFIATLLLTPEMSLALTKNKAAVTGQDPILLYLPAEGFYLPLPFSLEKLKIGKSKLSLGRFRLQHADYLSGLSIFLKTKKINTDQVDVWLGRADFSFGDSTITLYRTDALLANSIHLCAWGQTELVRQTLNMILGVPADTLATSFGIRSVSSKYVLQVPLIGTYTDPQLDTSTAGAKIAAIVAAGKVQKQGGVIGGVAGIINQAAQEKSPDPIRPYPWEK